MAFDTAGTEEVLYKDNNHESLEKLIILYHGLKTATLSPWELFGLRKNATREEKKEAFLSFIEKFHPDDVFPRAMVELREMADFVFAAANHAFDVLIEEESETDFDEENV